MRLDILIPTFNRSASLRECLQSVLQSTSAVDWRVTVVDNNSSDDTRQVVETLAKLSGRVRYLFEKKQGKSAALNCGIRASDYDAIGMIDDDEHLHPNWIDTAAKWLEDSEIDFIGGPYFSLWRTERPAWVPAGYEGVISADDPDRIPKELVQFPDDRVFLRGGNVVVRRSVFERVGLYRTDIGPIGRDFASCEDHEMYARLTAGGVSGYYVPDLIIYHVVPPERMTRAYYRKWAWGQAKSLAALDRINPQKAVYVGRIPRYMIGNAVRGVSDLASRNPARRFDAELRWWTLCGFARGAYRGASASDDRKT